MLWIPGSYTSNTVSHTYNAISASAIIPTPIFTGRWVKLKLIFEPNLASITMAGSSTYLKKLPGMFSQGFNKAIWNKDLEEFYLDNKIK